MPITIGASAARARPPPAVSPRTAAAVPAGRSPERGPDPPVWPVAHAGRECPQPGV